MKVFFTGSPRALKQFGKEHRAIYDAIKSLGHDNLSDDMISDRPEEFYSSDYDQVQAHYKETMDCLRKADILVAEGSFNSMSVGYLVEKALGMGKPVVIFHLPKYEPYFFNGIQDDKLQIMEYTLDSVKKTIKLALQFASDSMDTRFNFFVSPKHQNYLDWISRHRKVPRAVFLRRLIEREIEKDKGYKI